MPGAFVVAHVGDSRLYLARGGICRQVTVDHSLVNHYLDIGKLTAEQAVDFPQKNVILQALGLKETVRVDLQQISKVKDDVLLLCSDGLTDLVDELTIQTLLLNAHAFRVDDLARRLVRLALNNGGRDNVTALIVRVGPTLDEARAGGVPDAAPGEVTAEIAAASEDEVTAEIQVR